MSGRVKQDWEEEVSSKVKEYFANLVRGGDDWPVDGYHGDAFSNFFKQDMKEGFDELFAGHCADAVDAGQGWRMTKNAITLLPDRYEELTSFFCDVVDYAGTEHATRMAHLVFSHLYPIYK